MATDATLDTIGAQTFEIAAAIIALYDLIREAKATGYSYNELEFVTKFPRGNLQVIAAGGNPRFNPEPPPPKPPKSKA
ncbi:hypothetical protein [Mycolicibacterium sphagni]|uniref:Uncharacterized protein n=1 Tax=Mycolicibacterium sphagni TaxID=1786 RepID=A0A255DQS8_9MYCO|nr:hypothetical protein [Mycolicibacterium sphagni]OYN81758.1 hypothetical protein CG716_05285 [Mycolicibacterium sphagni]